MVVVVDINRFTVKRILVDSGSSCNILTWESVVALQMNISRLKKVSTLLVSIGGKSVKTKEVLSCQSL